MGTIGAYLYFASVGAAVVFLLVGVGHIIGFRQGFNRGYRAGGEDLAVWRRRYAADTQTMRNVEAAREAVRRVKEESISPGDWQGKQETC